MNPPEQAKPQLLASGDPSIVHLHIAFDPTTLAIEAVGPANNPSLYLWMIIVALQNLEPNELHAGLVDMVGALLRAGTRPKKTTGIIVVPPGTAIPREALRSKKGRDS